MLYALLEAEDWGFKVCRLEKIQVDEVDYISTSMVSRDGVESALCTRPEITMMISCGLSVGELNFPGRHAKRKRVERSGS